MHPKALAQHVAYVGEINADEPGGDEEVLDQRHGGDLGSRSLNRVSSRLTKEDDTVERLIERHQRGCLWRRLTFEHERKSQLPRPTSLERSPFSRAWPWRRRQRCSCSSSDGFADPSLSHLIRR